MITNKRHDRVAKILLNLFFTLLSAVFVIPILSVVFIAIFAAMFLGERLSPQATAGVALIAAGAVLVAWQ